MNHVYIVFRRNWLDAPPVATNTATTNAEGERWHDQRPCGKSSRVQHATSASCVVIDAYPSVTSIFDRKSSTHVLFFFSPEQPLGSACPDLGVGRGPSELIFGSTGGHPSPSLGREEPRAVW